MIVFLIAVALIFDFMNGFHDAANSIATIVSTGVLKPQYAVIWAAFFNVVAIFIFQLTVAATVGKGTIDPAVVARRLSAVQHSVRALCPPISKRRDLV